MTYSVGFLGIAGSFSYAAAVSYFKQPKINFIGLDTFEDIFKGIDSNKIKYGVVPIENSLAGSIYENYDLLDSYNLHIVGEHYIRVRHCLLACPGAKGQTPKIDQIKEVYSHQKALEQCANFFKLYSKIKLVAFDDTAHAAKFVGQQKDPTKAAIGGEIAADLYGLSIIKKCLEDDPYNYTRFLIVTKEQKAVDGANKCSMVTQIPHIPGSLYSVLRILEENGCNLMKIETRPFRKKMLKGRPFEYIFYVDFDYDPKKHNVDKIIDALRDKEYRVKLLGLYKESHT